MEAQDKLEIRLFGGLELLRGRQPVALPPSRKARALLAYLVARAVPVPRQRLCEWFFESPADPRAALRWSLTKLRPMVNAPECECLSGDQDQIVFDLRYASVDRFEYQALVGNEPAQAATDALRRAAALYRGDFLAGLELPECDQYALWRTAEAERLRAVQDRVLALLVERFQGRPGMAVDYAVARLQLNPFAETATIDLMRVLGRMGRIGEALKQFERCRRLLARELGIPPSPALVRARDALRKSRPATLMAPAAPGPARDLSAPVVLPPLVGREPERRRLRAWREASVNGSAGGVLWLLGEPGIGKTRLLRELGANWREGGGQTLVGRGFEVEMIRPYGPWIDLMRTLPVERIPENLHRDLAALLPELGEAGIGEVDRSRLFDAVLGLFATLGREERLLVLLDNLHWFDDASVSLLHYLARQAAAGLSLACAARSRPWRDNVAVERLIQVLEQEGRCDAIQLAPLDAEHTARLARSVDPLVDAGLVFDHSRGNPLFALEVARALKHGGRPFSTTLDNLIRARLADLDPPARELLPWMACLGHAFSLDQLARICDMPPPALLAAIQTLEGRGVLRVLSGGRYDFSHDLMRKTAYRRISAPCRRMIHARIARHLSIGDFAAGTLAGAVAHHADLAADHQLALRACIAAGRHGLRIFAYAEAAAHARRGAKYLEALPVAVRIEPALNLLELYLPPGMTEYRPPDIKRRIRTWITLARRTGCHAELSRGFYLVANLYYQEGNLHQAVKRSLQAESAGRAADPVTVVRAIAHSAKCFGMVQRDMPRAKALALEAESLAEGLDEHFYEIPLALGLVWHHEGRLRRAIGCYRQALALTGDQPDHWWECYTLGRLSMLELERGRPRAARRWCVELITMTGKMEGGSEAPFARALDALAALALDRSNAEAGIDAAAAELRAVDSQWMLAYVQAMAAHAALARSHHECAARWAREALGAARLVERHSEMAIARAVLSQLAVLAGDRVGAEAHLAAARVDLETPHRLSRIARRILQRTGQGLAAIQRP